MWICFRGGSLNSRMFAVTAYFIQGLTFHLEWPTTIFCRINEVLMATLHSKSWRSWVRASWYNYENNQQGALYRLIYYSKLALHVSGDAFAHYQEHLTVFTLSVSVHPNCCRLVSRMSWNWTTSSFGVSNELKLDYVQFRCFEWVETGLSPVSVFRMSWNWTKSSFGVSNELKLD